ncbi:MAG TPA: succinate dehydrogenase assembly factor 2 [Acetobacteraceae bacterium]|nr:succinate dehydrogenase assembly factor 2 [Acetobacteraceae bacterium]
MTEPATPLEPRRRRALYRATHRGSHENDLLIGGFVTRRIRGMDEMTLAALEALLELPEPDLADWISGRQPIPPEHDGPLLRAMRAAQGK